jgi:uncharacterized repeat protein (TIGR02543 family)
MRADYIKKIVVSIIAFAFMSTAIAPSIQSQLTAGFFSQQTSSTQNNERIRLPPYLVPQTVSPHGPPAPLDGTPPTIHLPSSQVTMKVFANSSISYFRTQLLNVPAGYEVTNKFYTGWCSDYAHYIYTNTPYQTYLYSSYNTSLPSRDYHQNWSKVNYILNHKQGTNWHQVQNAILYILDFGNQGLNATGWAMVNAAAQYGGSYIPHCGDIIVIIADPGENIQRQIFELTVPSYTLSITTDGSGTISKDPDQTGYTYGQVVTLTATPTQGWSFSYWSGNASGSNPVTTVTMNDNRAVAAHFTQDEYTLSTSVVGSGAISENPSQATYYYGDVVQVTATPDIGWLFSSWSGDLSGSSNPVSLTITGNMAVTALFTQNEYTLSINVIGSGSVGTVPAQATYHYGDVVQVSATPDIGWSFSGWSGDLTGSTNPASLTITGNMAVTASFTQNEYTLSTSVVGSGAISENPSQATYYYGDVVQLTATPDIGWSFSNWAGDLTGSTNPASLTITGNMAVTAYFSQNQYTLTITIDPVAGGSIAAVPGGPYYYGDVVTLTATPSVGYTFDHWSGDASGSNVVTTVTMDGNKAVTAHFTLSQYTLTITVDPSVGGSVGAVPAPPYYYGDIVTLTATANTGYTFDYWSGDASGSNTVTTVTMDENKAVIAHFTHIEYALTVTIDPDTGGTVSAVPGGPYYYGDVVTLTATANTGYTFDHWSGDASGSNPVTTVTMEGNKAVTAHFTQNVYTLTINLDPETGGSVTAAPSPPYHYNDIVKLTATANTGYTFDHWSGDATGSTLTVNVTIDGNKTVTAHFIPTGDVIPPLVEIAKPLNGIYLFDQLILPSKKPIIIQGITIQANASDNQSGVKRVEFFIDDISVGNDSTAPFTYTWHDLRSGTRHIKVVAYDNAGNSNAAEISVMKWRLHPVLAILLYYIIRPLWDNLKNWLHDHGPDQATTE